MGKSVGIVESKIFHCKDELALVCGKKLSEFELIYETYGKLNNNKTNAIFIPHALSGNHHIAGKYHINDKYSGINSLYLSVMNTLFIYNFIPDL